MSSAVQDKSSLLAILSANGEKITSYGVKNLSLFGSFASNQPKPESDVDLLVDFVPEKKTYDNFIELSFFIEDLLS